MKTFEQLKRRLIAIFLPERCAFCGCVVAPYDTICEACQREISVITPPICRRCGHHKADCLCRGKRQHFDGVTAPFYYADAVRAGILRLKRRDDSLAIDTFAVYMARAVQREYEDETIDGICFVPMTKRRLQEREYNQGELLAKALGKQLQLPVMPVLAKLYDTAMQKKMAFRIRRSGNVLGVFDVMDESVRDKTVLLVDDVLTTGATLNECAKMLKLYGAKRVLVVTLAIRKQKPKTDEN